LAVVAEVRPCGEGTKTVGCFSTAVVQLPGAREVVSVTTTPPGPETIRVKVSAEFVSLMVNLEGEVLVNLLPPRLALIAPAGRVYVAEEEVCFVGESDSLAIIVNLPLFPSRPRGSVPDRIGPAVPVMAMVSV
jgi:hypothetical protein